MSLGGFFSRLFGRRSPPPAPAPRAPEPPAPRRVVASVVQPDDETLLSSLRKHEGWRARPYICPAGALTIGYGHNLDAHPVPAETLSRWGREGMTREEGESILRRDVANAIEHARDYDWFPGLPLDGQRVVVEAIFQLGPAGWSKFRRTQAALAAHDWKAAAAGLRGSLWARQTPRRVESHARRLEALG